MLISISWVIASVASGSSLNGPAMAETYARRGVIPESISLPAAMSNRVETDSIRDSSANYRILVPMFTSLWAVAVSTPDSVAMI